ncbi:MAG: hypothetical protein LBC14_05275, partial [Desulfovibrio sp.]|nr:hypothetical protein [Desulfovibrio sp.]
MTTKLKIISGFGLMIILLAVVSVFGIIQLQSSEDGFMLYRRYARVNVMGSDLSTRASDILRHLNNFLIDFEPKLIDDAVSSLDSFAKLVQDARAMSRVEERRKALDDMGRRVEMIKPQLRDMRDYVLGVRAMYNDQVRPAYNTMYKGLNELADAARAVSNSELL